MTEDRKDIMGRIDRKVQRLTGGSPRYFDGGKRSIAVLKTRGFDPINALVDQYETLRKELIYHDKVRDGKIIPLTATGKERRYDSEAHMAVFNLLVQIGDKLLRYGYGRVPEGNVEGPVKPSTLVIKLNREGDEFVVGEQQPDYLPGELADEGDE